MGSDFEDNHFLVSHRSTFENTNKALKLVSNGIRNVLEGTLTLLWIQA